MIKKSILLLAILLMLASCQSANPATSPSPTLNPELSKPTLDQTLQQPSSQPETPLPTLVQATPQPTQTVPVEPSATAQPPQNTRYTIKAKFNYGLHNLTVAQDTAYTNNTAETLTELVMMVEPNDNPGVFHLATFTWANGQAIRSYSLDANILHLQLPQPLMPGQSLAMHLDYELRLPAIPAPSDDHRPILFGYSEKQVNLTDWYPCIAPYVSGAGWLAHKPWYYGEHQVYEMADFNVEIDLVDPPKDLMIAASAVANQSGNSYTYTQNNARNFTWSASPYYKLVTRQVGQVVVNSYAFTLDTVAGKGALQYTAQALELFGKLFAPYPHASLTVVEADFLDGMEYDGLFFLSRGFYNLYTGTPQGYLAAIAAHETAHQWWYALVMNDQALEPWLDEALATFCEYVFYKNLYPDDLKWWWVYRVDYYGPNGKINLRLYDYTSYTSYRNAVYLNGAHFLYDLQVRVGDTDFYAFLHDYAAALGGRLATANDFFTLLHKTSSVDISSITAKYFK